MIKEKYEDGIEIVSNRDECDSIIFIAGGKIEIEVKTDDGSQVVATLKRGDMIGCNSFLEGDKYDFSAIAVSKNVTIFKLPKEYVDKHIAKV